MRDLSGFGASLGEDFSICSFKNNGLAIYDDGKLIILFDFHQIGSRIEFGRKIQLNATPPIPREASINRMMITSDGSRIVLFGEKSIYLVLVCPEVVSLKGMRSEYFCDCVSLEHNIFLSHRSISISTARFLPLDLGWDNHLAVLFSDNTIRVFSLEGASDSSILSMDFSSMMFDGNTNQQVDNRFGLFKNLASFDFVYSASVPTLVAIDTDGDMYTAFLSGTDSESVVVRPLLSPPALPCEPTSLICVPHPFSNVFSVLSIYSPLNDGIISHVVVLPNENSFELTLQEKLKMPYRAENVHLLSSDRSCSYLLATSKRLYLMDIRPWISSYGQFMTGGVNNTLLQDTRLHSMAVVMTDESDKPAPSIGMTSLLDCTSDDGESVSMFVTRFCQPSLVASFLRCDLSLTVLPKNEASNGSIPLFKETVIDPILNKKNTLPKIISGPSVSQMQLLDEADKWAMHFTKNLNVTNEAVKITIKCVAEMFLQTEECKKKREGLDQNLLKLLEEFLALRERLDKKKASIDQLNNRIESLASRLAGKLPLTTQENKMLAALKDYRRQIMTHSIKFPQLSLDISEDRLASLGPARSFEPSAAAKTASLNRSVREVDELKNRVEKLDEMISKMDV